MDGDSVWWKNDENIRRNISEHFCSAVHFCALSTCMDRLSIRKHQVSMKETKMLWSMVKKEVCIVQPKMEMLIFLQKAHTHIFFNIVLCMCLIHSMHINAGNKLIMGGGGWGTGHTHMDCGCGWSAYAVLKLTPREINHIWMGPFTVHPLQNKLTLLTVLMEVKTRLTILAVSLGRKWQMYRTILALPSTYTTHTHTKPESSPGFCLKPSQKPKLG